ncbi:MAG TPA: hypothetical protein VI844_03660 [Coxiellaceae bacterium]|nr:hypothetical protein [Coxiellaceae bacterium]
MMVMGAHDVMNMPTTVASDTMNLSHLLASLSAGNLIFALLFALADAFLLKPMYAGVLLTPLRQAADKKTGFYVFEFFRWFYIWRFIVLTVFISVLVGVPAVAGHILVFYMPNVLGLTSWLLGLSCVAGIILYLFSLYLAVGYFLSPQLIIDKGAKPWTALVTSRRAVHKKWFTVFFAMIWSAIVIVFIPTIVTLIAWAFFPTWIVCLVGSIAFLLNVICATPYSFNLFAILYRNLLGISGQDPITLAENGMTQREQLSGKNTQY